MRFWKNFIQAVYKHIPFVTFSEGYTRLFHPFFIDPALDRACGLIPMHNRHKSTAVVLTALLFAASLVMIIPMGDDTQAAAGTEADPILVLPGQTWRYTPTFPEDLSPTLTVSASATAQPGEGATYETTSGYAKVTGGTIDVVVPAEATVGKYYITIKASTTQPTQVTYQNVVFQIQAKITGTGGTAYASESGAQDVFSVSASTAATYTITDYGTLTNGESKVTINSSTGALTVNAASGDAGTYTIKVKATATDNPTNTVIFNVTLVIKSLAAFTSSPSAGYIVEAGG